MITLAIDIGNTRAKAAVFNGNNLVHEQALENGDLERIIREYTPQHAVLSSVGKIAEEISAVLGSMQVPLLMVTYQTPFPFRIEYDTPETLGMDRVAGVAAAQFLFPSTHCLVIDAGTCITYDFIAADGVYKGGAISPGLSMRLKAMHEFTQKLPQPALGLPADFEGKSTVQSLLSGAVAGTVDEINGRIGRYMQRYGTLQVLLCGGDASLLAEQLKNNIFAAPSLVMTGLNQILSFHVNKG